MKAFFKAIISTILITPLLVVGAVTAVEDKAAAPTESESFRATTVPVESEEQVKLRLEAALKERIEKRKNQLKVRLNATEKTRIVQRCKPSQATIKNLGDKTNVNVPKRYKSYEALSEHLKSLLNKLESQDVDISALQTYRTVLDQKIDSFKTTMEAYQQTLSDLNAMNCANDPDAFKASLESARMLRNDLTEISADIRNYIKETVKPGLVTVRQQLQTNTEKEE